MNIILTSRCLNNCPYCFARDMLTTKNESSHITLDEFREILAFLKRSKFKRIRLLGGEPMLHPNIVEILEMSNNDGEFTNIDVFTSGRFPTPLFSHLYNAKRKLEVVFNLKEENDYRPQEYQETLSMLRLFVDSGIKLSLSYTIYKTDFNPETHLHVLKEYGIPSLRWSLASPTSSGSNSYLVIKKHDKIFGEKLGTFLLECAELHVHTHVDCAIPLCVFSSEMRGKLEWVNPALGSLHPPGLCSPALDIGAGLNAWRCFGLPELSVNMKNFNTIEELNKALQQEDIQMKWIGTDDECKNCDASQRNLCQGGCLAFRRKDALNDPILRKYLQSNAFTNILTIPDFICDSLYTLLLQGEEEIFLTDWEYLRKLPIFFRYHGSNLLDAFYAELQGDFKASLRKWRQALPFLKDERQEFARQRIIELQKGE